jgi:SAM-dependent methyltransferase
VRWILVVVAVALLQTAAPVYIPYGEAGLPKNPDLRSEGRSYLQTAAKDWPDWVARRDAEIRARLARGDEDSLVYLWLFGTSFTKRPRATTESLARLRDPARAEALLIDRLEDFVAAIGSASAARNERLQFARIHLASKGIDVGTEAGRLKALEYLVKARERVVAENAAFTHAAEAARRSTDADAAPGAYATLFRDRGLSSDTRLVASFAIDAALVRVAEAGLLPSRGVPRAAIVGPGLDFTDKADGFDFYPQQTIQPFGLIDSLMRLGLVRPGDFRLTTYDLSPRVNAHLASAIARAARGSAYTMQLPRPAGQSSHEWQPDLAAYWETFGQRIGRPASPAPLPPGVTGVRLRSITVNPRIVSAITPKDLNIIVQRDPLAPSERFDLIVATNVLVYYDAFDQAMALANIASMLKPGGLFLTNYAIAPSAQMEALPRLTTRVFFDAEGNGDSVYCYRRR